LTESGENGPWGFSPDVKLDNTLRIGFQNLGGFPEFPSHPKNHEFRSFIAQYEFDIFGVAETNVKWCNMPAASQFYERVRNTWDKTPVSLARELKANLRSNSTEESLYCLLLKLRIAFPGLAVTRQDSDVGLGQVIMVEARFHLRSLRLTDPVSRTAQWGLTVNTLTSYTTRTTIAALGSLSWRTSPET
jgi:hypothetical protein